MFQGIASVVGPGRGPIFIFSNIGWKIRTQNFSIAYAGRIIVIGRRIRPQNLFIAYERTNYFYWSNYMSYKSVYCLWLNQLFLLVKISVLKNLSIACGRPISIYFSKCACIHTHDHTLTISRLFHFNIALPFKRSYVLVISKYVTV